MTAPANFEIRSNEAGAFLGVERDPEPERPAAGGGDHWNVTLSCGSLRASLRFYEPRPEGLAEYFVELARDWRGWSGDRRWESLEGDAELSAAHDGRGTIALRVTLRTETSAHHRWTASADLVLDAGGLDQLARQVRQIL